jgi:hypothetical protein
MAYGAYTGMYTVDDHHRRRPPRPDSWRAIPGLGQAVPEGGFPGTQTGLGNPEGIPPDPRTRFGYPRGPTRRTPGASRVHRRRQRN